MRYVVDLLFYRRYCVRYKPIVFVVHGVIPTLVALVRVMIVW